jgi:hypothetical protein
VYQKKERFKVILGNRRNLTISVALPRVYDNARIGDKCNIERHSRQGLWYRGRMRMASLKIEMGNPT